MRFLWFGKKKTNANHSELLALQKSLGTRPLTVQELLIIHRMIDRELDRFGNDHVVDNPGDLHIWIRDNKTSNKFLICYSSDTDLYAFVGHGIYGWGYTTAEAAKTVTNNILSKDQDAGYD